VILKETFGALRKGSVVFVGPPKIQTLAMDPLGASLAFTGSNHGVRTIVFQTDSTALFFIRQHVDRGHFIFSLVVAIKCLVG
jgi:hypothetical protein